jgi:tellurium resistance protein TerD
MAINLTKGQTIDLRKDTNDLSQITIGLGWKIREKKSGGFLEGLFGKKDDEEFDLDAIAFLLDENEKVTSLGNDKLEGGDIVFFNSLKHPTGLVYHSGDNLVGGSGTNDDEQIVVKLNSIPANFHKIIFLVCIYKGNEKKQHFGQVETAYVRAIDGKGNEMARYSLSAESAYDGKCTMVFGEVYRRNDGWKFRAIGDAHPFDSFVPLLRNYLPA